MGQRKHKAEDVEKRNRAKPARETDSQVEHPLLRLQQTVGNKAVAKMIQREKDRRVRLEASNVNASIVQRHPEDSAKIWNLQNLAQQNADNIRSVSLAGDVYQSRGLRNQERLNSHATSINGIISAIEAHRSGGGHVI